MLYLFRMCSMWQSEYLLVDVLRVLWCFCKALPQNTIIMSYLAWPPTPTQHWHHHVSYFPRPVAGTSWWRHTWMFPFGENQIKIIKLKDTSQSLSHYWGIIKYWIFKLDGYNWAQKIHSMHGFCPPHTPSVLAGWSAGTDSTTQRPWMRFWGAKIAAASCKYLRLACVIKVIIIDI